MVKQTRVKEFELRARGMWDCARLGLASERYTQDHGRLPADLSELAPTYLPEIPREPFGDGPYGWEQKDGIGVLSFAFPDKHMPPYTFTVLGPRGGGGGGL